MKSRWLLYRTLERLTGGGHKVSFEADKSAPPALTVYASTLGEFNAISPFLKAFHARRPRTPINLLSEHPHYFPSFEKAWPQARCFAIDARSETAQAFFKTQRTGIFVLAEIPLLPHDAPARLPFAWLHYAKQSGAAIALLNGWLYHEPPACRMDRLERAWFGRAQLDHFDLITVQDETTRDRLIELGASASRIHVPGNLKFDFTPPGAQRAPLFSERPVVVAGSMNNMPEYHLLLDGFAVLRTHQPQCALIIAPRHPENTTRTDALCALLAQRGLSYALASQARGQTLKEDCLVLDTLGDLAGCYREAACAHVGINHTVLEPLRFGKRVTVSPGWEPRYPSFGLRTRMQEEGLVVECPDAKTLGQQWLWAIDQAAQDTSLLSRFAGGSARTLHLMQAAGWV
ncbi:MAG: hypothetical protein RIR70_1021 [Pseudomonadota bacterium]|jgi:3-deoxy-D-manno-octulosonic-acid transferase